MSKRIKNILLKTKMLGGSLTRYHTPVLKGKGFTRDVVQWATPSVLQSIGSGMNAFTQGATPGEAIDQSGAMLQRNLKRQLPSLVKGAVKRKVTNTYKNTRKRFKDIFHV